MNKNKNEFSEVDFRLCSSLQQESMLRKTWVKGEDQVRANANKQTERLVPIKKKSILIVKEACWFKRILLISSVVYDVHASTWV